MLKEGSCCNKHKPSLGWWYEPVIPVTSEVLGEPVAQGLPVQQSKVRANLSDLVRYHLTVHSRRRAEASIQQQTPHIVCVRS